MARPFAHYTPRVVAISNRRLVSLDANSVSFPWKDYGAKGRVRHKTMTLTAEEFMRRFLLHVLPCGFHRIRHYGLLANVGRRQNLARARELLGATPPDEPRILASAPEPGALSTTPTTGFVCRCCGSVMRVIETFARGATIRAPPLQGATS